MEFIFVILFIFSVFSYYIARGDVQRLVKSADHVKLAWRRVYTCDFHNAHAPCVWLKGGQPFDPAAEGYKYLNSNNCSFEANNVSLDLSHFLGCVGCTDGHNGNSTNSTDVSSTQISNEHCKPQLILERPEDNEIKWLHTYSCGLINARHCKWLQGKDVFYPTRFRYHYTHPENNNCSIRANNYAVKALHNDDDPVHTIFCIGNIRYNNTNMDTDLKQSVELHCPVETERTSCVWKRNDVVVDVFDGIRYSYISTPSKSIDCAIRIEKMESSDFGRWTCSTRMQEIISAFTLSLR